MAAGLVMAATSAMAQAPSAKLKAAFGTNELSAIAPEEIGFMNWFADNGYLINPMEGKNLTQYADINTLAKDPKYVITPEIDPKNFNPYLYNITTQDRQPTVYVIGNSVYTVFFYANEMARMNYNRYKLILEKQK